MSKVAATTSAHKDEGITERSLRSIKWNYFGVAARMVIQLVTQVAFARMLGPEPFGIFAIVALIIGFIGIIIENGIGSALIQADRIDELQIRHAFTKVFFGGTTAAILLYLASGAIASVFGNPDLKTVLHVMAPTLVISNLAIISQALLHRDFSFGMIQVARLISYTISYGFIGITLAWHGAGIWSLVVAWYMQTIITLCIFFSKRPHPIRFAFGRNKTRQRKFGTTIMLTNIIIWVGENFDQLVISKTLGSIALGLYSISYNLVRTPATHLVSSLQTVLFPASARAQKNLAGLQRAYLTVISGISLIVFPLFFVVSAVSSTIIEALFGDRWSAAASVTTPLSLAMVAYSLTAIAGPMLAGKGSPGIELKIQFWTTLMFIGLVVAASLASIQAVAWTVFLVYLFRAGWITALLLKSFEVPLIRFLRAFQGGAVLTATVLPVALLTDQLMVTMAQPASYRLITIVIFCSLQALIMSFSSPGQIFSSELRLIMGRLAKQSSLLDNSLLMRRIRQCDKENR